MITIAVSVVFLVTFLGWQSEPTGPLGHVKTPTPTTSPTISTKSPTLAPT